MPKSFRDLDVGTLYKTTIALMDKKYASAYLVRSLGFRACVLQLCIHVVGVYFFSISWPCEKLSFASCASMTWGRRPNIYQRHFFLGGGTGENCYQRAKGLRSKAFGTYKFWPAASFGRSRPLPATSWLCGEPCLLATFFILKGWVPPGNTAKFGKVVPPVILI